MSSRTNPTNANSSKQNDPLTAKLAPKTGAHVIEVWADKATWDTTSSAAINVELTNLNEPK
jgi:hypothetical protein